MARGDYIWLPERVALMDKLLAQGRSHGDVGAELTRAFGIPFTARSVQAKLARRRGGVSAITGQIIPAHAPPVYVAKVVEHPARMKRLTTSELALMSCRFPLWGSDDDPVEGLYCGNRVERTPYCECHRQFAFVKSGSYRPERIHIPKRGKPA